ncbi:sulfurtransferase complex subunit TusC [Shewanella psychrotolerans]|uniref:sulfurtransferase complex subunit TusC n=1 Tax=Shewanella psychrotolerans TaxID=2864206 RepID=UPI001C6578E1|nr:sulfurtransferase complex subunit TusC [Shewanella psychrotolerans]QYK03073.1 sulfurtransferase complex subunit TusC [Shewanella psychrotolerans]
MKTITIIFRHSPHGKANSREALDFALLSASFEQIVSVIFVDDGVLNLLPNQMPSKIGCRDFISTFKALSLYDIEDVFVCETSLVSMGLTTQDCFIDVEALSNEQIKQRLKKADEVLVY